MQIGDRTIGDGVGYLRLLTFVASILDWLYETLPRPPFTESETDSLAERVYGYVSQRSRAGGFAAEAGDLQIFTDDL